MVEPKLQPLADELERRVKASLKEADDIRYYSGGSPHNASRSHMADWVLGHADTIIASLRALEALSAENAKLLEACVLYDDAIDMMFDGPDESDEGYAKARWREARQILAALKEPRS